jgi:hypothetical protein
LPEDEGAGSHAGFWIMFYFLKMESIIITADDNPGNLLSMQLNYKLPGQLTIP